MIIRQNSIKQRSTFTISIVSIRNNKNKINLSIDRAVTKTLDNIEFLNIFKNFHFTATFYIFHYKKDLAELVANDIESSNVFQKEILEETNRFYFE